MVTREFIKGMLQGKCPNCYRSNIFRYPISKIFKFSIMNERCEACKVSFEPEPGFYQGAMFVGYGLAVGGLILISLVLYLVDSSSEWTYVIAVTSFVILTAPFNFRYSRILYLYFFGGIRANTP